MRRSRVSRCSEADARLARLCSVLIASIFIVSACGESEAQSVSGANPVEMPGGFELPDLDQLPESQRPAFEDGSIATAEYSVAFDRFQTCANADGEAVVINDRDAISGYIVYGIKESVGGSIEDPTSPSGRCYVDEFKWIEIAWQGTDPTVLEQSRQSEVDRYANEVLPCLTKNGIDAPPTFDGNYTQEFVDLSNEWVRLDQAGQC